MKTTLLEILRERRLVCDGAMGTQLMLAGLEQGACGEAWNLAHPERVEAIQRRYAEAGADCLITNTFGGSRLMLGRHGHDGDVAAINQAGARIARQAFGARPGFVLGDIGPLGAILEPYGELSVADAQSALENRPRRWSAPGSMRSSSRPRRPWRSWASRSTRPNRPAHRASSPRWLTTYPWTRPSTRR